VPNKKTSAAQSASVAPQPFLKWAGGKTQLLPQFNEFFPLEINNYFEPFVGGGAVFFYLKHRFPKMKAFLRDINPDLINAYRAVRDQPEKLMKRLDEHAAKFQALGESYFYLVRSKHDLPAKRIVDRAARMIFLNKTCFNGLYRVNSRGEFNVPVGSYNNPSLYDRENILAASNALKGVRLKVQNFHHTFDETKRDDFIYVDPPYYPVSSTANFTSYSKDDFGEGEQQELHAVSADAARRSVRVMLSNSDASFIRKLYADFAIHVVLARRAINRDGSKRGLVNELVITNKLEEQLLLVEENHRKENEHDKTMVGRE